MERERDTTIEIERGRDRQTDRERDTIEIERGRERERDRQRN